RVADRDQPIDRSQRQPVDKLLDERVHRLSAPLERHRGGAPFLISPSRNFLSPDCNRLFHRHSRISVAPSRAALPFILIPFRPLDQPEASTGRGQCPCVESGFSQLSSKRIRY